MKNERTNKRTNEKKMVRRLAPYLCVTTTTTTTLGYLRLSAPDRMTPHTSDNSSNEDARRREGWMYVVGDRILPTTACRCKHYQWTDSGWRRRLMTLTTDGRPRAHVRAYESRGTLPSHPSPCVPSQDSQVHAVVQASVSHKHNASKRRTEYMWRVTHVFLQCTRVRIIACGGDHANYLPLTSNNNCILCTKTFIIRTSKKTNDDKKKGFSLFFSIPSSPLPSPLLSSTWNAHANIIDVCFIWMKWSKKKIFYYHHHDIINIIYPSSSVTTTTITRLIDDVRACRWWLLLFVVLLLCLINQSINQFNFS